MMMSPLLDVVGAGVCSPVGCVRPLDAVQTVPRKTTGSGCWPELFPGVGGSAVALWWSFPKRERGEGRHSRAAERQSALGRPSVPHRGRAIPETWLSVWDSSGVHRKLPRGGGCSSEAEHLASAHADLGLLQHWQGRGALVRVLEA